MLKVVLNRSSFGENVGTPPSSKGRFPTFVWMAYTRFTHQISHFGQHSVHHLEVHLHAIGHASGERFIAVAF